jgi:hypothetical protein
LIVSIVLAKTASARIVTRGVGDCKIPVLADFRGPGGPIRHMSDGMVDVMDVLNGSKGPSAFVFSVRWRGVLEFVPQVLLGTGGSRVEVLLKLVHS